jgi:hypothetical protein
MRHNLGVIIQKTEAGIKERSMSKAEIFPGACGFNTVVVAKKEGSICKISIESDCEAIQELSAHLKQVDPLGEITFKKNMPKILEMGAKYCMHAACPVPVGIIKAIEVEAGLNLPKDVTIKLSKK